MLNTNHLGTVLTRFKKMDLDVKKIKKYYKDQFKTYGYKCRMKFTNTEKLYETSTKLICEIFYDTINVPDNIRSGNAFIVASFIDDHFLFLDEIKNRVTGIKDKDMLRSAHEQILEKQKEIFEVLRHNISNPISLEDFQKALKEGDEVNGWTDTAKIGNWSQGID